MFEPGPMWALGLVQCLDWARFKMGIGPSFYGIRPNVSIGPGSMWGSGQDHWGMGPGPMLALNWHTFGNLAPGL